VAPRGLALQGVDGEELPAAAACVHGRGAKGSWNSGRRRTTVSRWSPMRHSAPPPP
jgi:hypothetical protein